MKKLIITEKPSVARTFASVLNVTDTKDGYIENDEYIISWCVGHLIGMSYPESYDSKYKSWNMEHLPFLPEKYKYETIKNVRVQYNTLKTLLNRKDISVIYNATDSDREGQLILSYVYMLAGYNKSAERKRIWIDSHTDKSIRKGINNALPEKNYYNLTEAAMMRAIVDYAIGINFSRALTLKFSSEFNKSIKGDKFRSINVGRVMTCVLGMVVIREREIRNFKSTSFYKVEADIGNEIISLWKAVKTSHFYESPLLYNETGFLKKEYAEKFIKNLSTDPRLMIQNIHKKEEKKNPQYLFNLAELQSECSKKFKINPEETLKIAQKLYESKLTTYPRTDARVLSSPVCLEIPGILKELGKNSVWEPFIAEIMNNNYNTDMVNTRYCDDSKITGHYAIIPTGEGKAINDLSEIEKNVYELITKRFLAIFFPPAVYHNMQIAFIHPSGEVFFMNKKELVEKGFLEVIGIHENDVQKKADISELKVNDVYNATFQIKEGSTTAPKRYDSGSIILAMENAGNLIEDEELRSQIKGSGIGTSATRGEILKKLFEINYLALNKKTQILTPTREGELVYDIVEKTIPALLSPVMTASWEKGLSQIEKGDVSRNEYTLKLNSFIIKGVSIIKEQKSKEKVPDRDIVACPFCDGMIKETPYGYQCDKAGKEEDKCKFFISGSYGKAIKKEDLLKLIKEGKTGLIKNIKNREGKIFDATLVLDLYEKKIKVEFPKAEEKICDLKCPKCQQSMKETKWKYQCDCGFSVFHTISQRKLDTTEMETLFATGKTNVKGFTSKKGKRFNATLTFNGNEIKMIFDN